MFVNRYKILAKDLSTAPTGSTMVLPFSLDFIPVDNSDLVQKEFVEKETKKSINPIVNYEKSRFTPYNQYSQQVIKEIKIKLWKDPTTPLTYSDLGMTNSDVSFRRNRFLNTFLRLSFYDSEEVTKSNFLFSVTYFTQLGDDQKDITGCSPADPLCPTPNYNYGKPLDVSSMPVSYLLSNPIILPKKMAEGYYLYWLNKYIEDGPKNIYMKASLNNAVDGKTINYFSISTLTPPQLNPQFFNNLNVKYTIFKDQTDGIFKYNIDNVDREIFIDSNLTTINLYKLVVQ
jgi:hypothetical protein